MNEKPILFSAPMVNAILEGRKTQTRRVVTGKIALEWLQSGGFSPNFVADPGNFLSPYGYAGDQLWVRETWKCEELEPYGEDGVRFRADGVFRGIENSREASDKWADAYREGAKWRPSIFMPRWASRITLKVVNVRVERVQEISNDDAIAEGVDMSGLCTNTGPQTYSQFQYQMLWNEINDGRGFGWDINPWVWVVEFKVV